MNEKGMSTSEFIVACIASIIFVPLMGYVVVTVFANCLEAVAK